MDAARIGAEALKLSPEDRAELAAMIVASLDDADPNDAGGGSLEEARARGAQVRSGEVEPIAEEEFLAEFQARRGR